MANDRIYIRCKGCGETLYIGKSMGEGFYCPICTEPLEDRFNKFYEEHAFCKDFDEGNYEITYESEKEKGFTEQVIETCRVCIQTPTWCPLMKEKPDA